MSFKSLFLFNRKQQRGIFILLLLLIITFIIYIYTLYLPKAPLTVNNVSNYQHQIDSLKKHHKQQQQKIYPFNPNFISDYRGYKLGLNEQQLDRLHRFRESGKFVNSKSEFQQLTQVSDQWMDSISPYFKFPDWVNKAKNNKRHNNTYSKPIIKPQDINQSNQQTIQAVYGIGPAISKRIIKEREQLNGFIDYKQIRDIYGMSDSTMIQFKKHFYIKPPPTHTIIALNTATRDQLLTIPYFNDYLVDQLIKQRTLRQGFKSWDKVKLTSRFPIEKIELIQLYLTLD